MEIERGAGLSLLVGSLPKAGIEITIVDPFGNTARTFSGSKPEYGVGGFETWAPQVGTYKIRFLDQAFEVPMNGQFTRLSFSEQAATGQGVISGVLRDQAGAPQAGQQITLAGAGVGTRTATTGGDGTYRFDQLQGGSYTLSVVGTQVTQAVQSDGRTPVTVDLTLPAPVGEQWTMEVSRGSGLPLLVGSLPEAGISITITDPSGAAMRVTSGSKTEYGVGGFETYAPRSGTYTIQFLDQTFSLPLDGQFTHVTFKRGAAGETQARLVSAKLPHLQADAWLQYFEADQRTRGLFTLEEV